MRWSWSWRWELAIAGLAVVGAVAALWITLRAHFLAHPGWSAAQKADFILGPIGVGLYWRLRRPGNRLGLLLIVLGLFGVLYIGSSINAPVPFGIGVFWEGPIVLLTWAAILAFPSGRLDGPAERGILAFAVLTNLSLWTALWLTAPRFAPAFSISGCRGVCPANGAAIWSPLPWTPQLVDALRAGVIAVALTTAGLLVWKFVTGTSPRRRALAIGAPVALLYLLTQATFQALQLFTPADASTAVGPIKGAIDWTFAAARSAVWYGFLFALIAAELFAGRVLKEVVRGSLCRPSVGELERMLRDPLGDPGLRLGFWRPASGDWASADGAVLEPDESSGQAMTQVRRDGRPAAAIVHDRQITEDPELLDAAGAVALMSLENAELDVAWRQSLQELSESRTRLVQAGDRERRKLERDLHDGAQARLVAAMIDLSLAAELGEVNPDRHERVDAATVELDEALAELREVAHGIYPTVLAEWGLARAFEPFAARYRGRVTLIEVDPGRFAPELEAAIYYCCLEAVQNASKHAGADARISIRLYTTTDRLHLEVRDDGPGFDIGGAHDGIGLQNMRDRLGAVGGHVEIRSHPGRGTEVAAAAPLSDRPAANRGPGSSNGHSTLARTAGSDPAT
ncbi:MAG: hypothetical protein JO363_04625 [Solirubrobacterales bacterium]|nr:hypothetical protein [Solirubrobacterales bacterium]